MATFDFPIYKDDQVVKKRTRQHPGLFPTLFPLDKSTGKEALKKLKNDYQTHLRDISALFRLHPPYRKNTIRGVRAGILFH